MKQLFRRPVFRQPATRLPLAGNRLFQFRVVAPVVALTVVVGLVTLRMGFAASIVTFTPTIIPLSAAELPNSYHGEYSWIGSAIDPPGWPSMDVYYRDELQWGSNIERSQGQYDFTLLDQGMAKAKSMGGHFGFRVMADCPGCGDNLTPGYVPRQSGGQPDWNSEGFLSSWENLMRALGTRYNQDPRLGWVDVGGYGSWGEWHTSELGGADISEANAKRMIQAVTNAFPSKYVLMMTANPTFLADGMAISPKMGVRADCLGAPGFMGSTIDQVPTALSRWKTAPFVTEWCGSSSSDEMATGEQQVRQYHIALLSSGNYPTRYNSMSSAQQANFQQANKESGYRFVLNSLSLPGDIPAGSAITVTSHWTNVNVTPAYDNLNVMIQLRNPSSGAVAYEGKSQLDLRSLLPSTTTNTITDTLSVPSTLAAGTYDVAVKVVDAQGYLPATNLAIGGKTADGAYKLGQVTVSGSGQSSPTPTPTPTPTPSSTPIPTPTPGSTTNLLLGKTFVSSAGAVDGPIGNLNDNNDTTRWISDAGASNVAVSTDLGTSQSLSKVSILWAGDTTNNYDVQVSNDNVNWTTVASGSTSNVASELKEHTLTNVSGRYFRIVCKDLWDNTYGHSIYEIRLYGGPIPTPTPTPTPSGVLGDLNGDGRVSIFDLSNLLVNWGKTGAADLNHDGIVNITDLSLLLSHWTR